MAFFRFSRDKRGYQHFYLVEPVANRRGKVRQRVLYWFRSPPDIKVGREPFDESVRRALEEQNPEVTFDWRAILEAPIPSADAEKWRERRRAERAAKQAVAPRLADARSGQAGGFADARSEQALRFADARSAQDAGDDDEEESQGDAIGGPAEEDAADLAEEQGSQPSRPDTEPAAAVASPSRESLRRKRRRRRGKRPSVTTTAEAMPIEPARVDERAAEPSSDEQHGSDTSSEE